VYGVCWQPSPDRPPTARADTTPNLCFLAARPADISSAEGIDRRQLPIGWPDSQRAPRVLSVPELSERCRWRCREALVAGVACAAVVGGVGGVGGVGSGRRNLVPRRLYAVPVSLDSRNSRGFSGSRRQDNTPTQFVLLTPEILAAIRQSNAPQLHI
jgi:hypothetical protein